MVLVTKETQHILFIDNLCFAAIWIIAAVLRNASLTPISLFEE